MEKKKEEKVIKKGKEVIREGKEAKVKETAVKNYEIILHPLITEKAVNAIETENKLCFVVDKNASKQDVRKAIEVMYAVKVDGVNILRDMKGRKKAIVKINEKFKANDIAIKLGVI